MYSGKGKMAPYTKSLQSKISFPELNILKAQENVQKNIGTWDLGFFI